MNPDYTNADSKLAVSLSDGILSIEINRPEARNALTHEMERHFDAVLDIAEADESVRAVTLTGRGPVFCAGHDLKDAIELFANGKSGPPPARALPRAWYFPKPLVAGVHSFVGPGGFELTAGCDFIIAAERTRWSFEQTRAGGGAPSGSFMILHFQLPMRVLSKLWMMGGYFEAEQALQWNFVQRVLPEEAVADEVHRWAVQAAKIPAEQYRNAKASLRRVYEIFGLNAAVGVQNSMKSGGDIDGELRHSIQAKGLKAALADRSRAFDIDIAKI